MSNQNEDDIDEEHEGLNFRLSNSFYLCILVLYTQPKELKKRECSL